LPPQRLVLFARRSPNFGDQPMQLLSPDILQDACEISVPITATAFAVGLLVWALGWRGHRFWIVLAATVAAGILGLYSGPIHKTQPMVAGLLLAVAAGALALALVRVVAFASGAIALWIAVHALMPNWHEPLVALLVGGLIGLLLFRVWTMTLTSSAGALIMAYSGLCLAHKLGNVDVVALAENHPLMLNCLCGAAAIAGLAVQYLITRRRESDTSRRDSRPKSQPQNSGGLFWWSRGRSYRRAG
jgi:hypothetical protein